MFVLKEALFLLRMRQGWIQKPKRLMRVHSYAHSNIFALVAHEAQYDEVMALADRLKADKKNVRTLFFSPKRLDPYQNNQKNASYVLYYSNILSASGALKAKNALTLIATPYDFALNLSHAFNPYIEYVMLKIQAALKMGFYDNRRIHDYQCLLRGKPKHFNTYADFVYHYLGKI